jgi:hypothetical protein
MPTWGLILALLGPVGIALKSLKQSEHLVEGRMYRLGLLQNQAARLVWRDQSLLLSHGAFILAAEAGVLTFYFERVFGRLALIMILTVCGIAALAAIVWLALALHRVFKAVEQLPRKTRKQPA